MSDLWPDEFGSLNVVPPLTILKEQAAAITAKTRQQIVGEVRQVTSPWKSIVTAGFDFVYDFDLTAPFLDDYSYNLFRVLHKIDLYPVTVRSSSLASKDANCANPDELMNALKGIFGSEQTKKVINALLAQTSAATNTNKIAN